MPWFRLSSLIFAAWAVLFFFFPRFSNEFASIDSASSGLAEDWTRIVGLFALGFAVLLHQVHRVGSAGARRLVARGVLAFTVPCALLMTYWQLSPERRWIRLDIGNILLLCLISYGLLSETGSWGARRTKTDAGD